MPQYKELTSGICSWVFRCLLGVENAQRAHSPQLAAGNASEYWYYQKVLTFGRFPADCFRELQLKEISHYLARPVIKFGPWLGI